MLIGGTVLADLAPRVADNQYRGRRLGLWLFALLLVKIPMGVNVLFNGRAVAQSADGIPLQTFPEQAQLAFLFLFAAWGLCQLIFGATCLLVLFRYRSLVPLAFGALLLEQAGRMLLKVYLPLERAGSPPGVYINAVLLGVIALGLVLSLWRPRGDSGGA